MTQPADGGEVARRTLAHYDARAEAFWAGTRDHDVRQNIEALLRHAATAGKDRVQGAVREDDPVLLVEDELFIALDVQATIEAAGFAVEGPCMTLVEAQEARRKMHVQDGAEDAFALAYVRPGMRKVNQALGRLVRLEDIPGYHERHAVRPGLTGLTQIFASRYVSRTSKFRLDRLYIKRAGFWLDIRLIFISFWITARGSWADGQTETYAFTEIDRSLSAGLLLNGARWARAGDTLGLAGDLADGIHNLVGSLHGSGIHELDVGQQVTLVLWGDEAGGCDLEIVIGGVKKTAVDQQGNQGKLQEDSDHAAIQVGADVEDSVEDGEEPAQGDIHEPLDDILLCAMRFQKDGCERRAECE